MALEGRTRFGSPLSDVSVAGGPLRDAAARIAALPLSPVDRDELAAAVVVADALLTFTSAPSLDVLGDRSARCNAVLAAALVRAAGLADRRAGVADLGALPSLGWFEGLDAVEVLDTPQGRDVLGVVLGDPDVPAALERVSELTAVDDPVGDLGVLWDRAGGYVTWLSEWLEPGELHAAVSFVTFDLGTAGPSGWYGQLAAALQVAAARC